MTGYRPVRVNRGITATWRILVVVAIALVATACVVVRPGPSRSPVPSISFAPVGTRTPRPTPATSVAVSAAILQGDRETVSRRLQAFVDAVPDGTRIEFPANLRVELARGIVVDGRRDLAFDGNATELITSGCGVEASSFVIGREAPSQGILVREFTLTGGNENAGGSDAHDGDCEFQMGVAIYRSTGIEIDDVSTSRMTGDCVYVGGAGEPLAWSSDVWYHDSVCTGTGRMGVAIVAGSDVRVERVSFDEIAISAMDIEPNGADGGADGVLFLDNTVGTVAVDEAWNPWLFEANGSEDATVRNVQVIGTVSTRHGLLMKVQRPNRFDFVIRENRSTVPADGPVMFFDGVDGLVVAGNEQPLTSGPLASIKDSTDVTYVP